MSGRWLSVAVLALTGVTAFPQTTPRRFRWPTVTPLERSYSFRDASIAKLSIKIRDATGNALYLLQCANTDLEGEGEVMPGDFACWMHAINPKSGLPRSLNLLHPGGDEQGGFYDRECVWVWQLAGKCSDYPDFGLERTFFLRGMKLTLTFRNVVISPESDESEATFKSFDLSISVRPERSATGSSAAPSPFEASDAGEHGCEIARRAR